ncbi:hypothetical protein [Spiroplasma endosymbiont of Polydrusus formosus]
MKEKIADYKSAFQKHAALFAIPTVELKAFEGLLTTDKDKKAITWIIIK